ncbi:hypothetical protein ACFVSQ_35600 [Streptomyces niveus]|uniref:hypothetical protein n=1 Tax=Streptomyces niveus TaxID=193462 RepID=UPI0036E94BD3
MPERIERDWDDDSEYHAALARAERLTRFGMRTMSGVTVLIILAILLPLLLMALSIFALLSMWMVY